MRSPKPKSPSRPDFMRNANQISWLVTSAFACACLYGNALAPADAETARTARQLEEDVVPPVFVTGETRQKHTLADRMSALEVPGLSVAVIHNGRIDWAQGYGITEDGGPSVTPQTLFQAASISKPISALAALRAVEAGKLDLDTDVNRYLKHWQIPSNSFTQKNKVTLRELLSHTAGMTVHGFPGYASNETLPTIEQVLDGVPPANSPAVRVDTAPGSQWRYSGGGYVIVQKVLEDVLDKPFSTILRSSVLIPLGMNRSTFEQPLPKKLMASAAMPYDDHRKLLEGGPHTFPERAAAGLWTTPSDLARYAIEVQRSVRGESTRLLSKSMTQQMLKPGMNKWGLGLQIGGSEVHPYFEHGGVNAGYRCELVAYEGGGDGAIIMTNSDNGAALISEVLRTIAYEYHWPDFQPPTRQIAHVDPTLFDSVVGSYRLTPSFILTATRQGDRLFLQATGQRAGEIFPESEDTYFSKEVDAELIFKFNGTTRAQTITLRQGGIDQSGDRLDDAAARAVADALTAINNRVQSQAPNPESEAAVRELMNGLASGRPNYEKMSPDFAEATRQGLGELTKLVKKFGSVVSVTFREVRPDGVDIYDMVCEHGLVEWSISLGPDGKIEGAFFN
jgi:CubicO group peptidase (beta-lactamase class C family)